MNWPATNRAFMIGAYLLGVCVLLYACTVRTAKQQLQPDVPAVYAAEPLAPTAFFEPKSPAAILTFGREPVAKMELDTDECVRPAWGLFAVAVFAFLYMMVILQGPPALEMIRMIS